MAHSTLLADPGRPGSGNVRIYIDNSNLWIQGQKTYAEKKGLREPWDPTWRFDVGRLKALLLGKSGLLPEEKEFTVKVTLYGSTPPPVDTVWRAIESHDVKVSTFERSSWTGREKEVDAEIIADSVYEACEDYHTAAGAVFIVVSGDRDIDRAIQKISQNCGFKVHVWSWKNALAGVYSQRKADRVMVHYLDDYVNDIGFHESAFRLDRSVFDAHSIVIIDALSKADEIRDFLFNLPTATYRYDSSSQDETEGQDLIIVPAFARYMTYNQKADLFQEAQEELQAHGLQVLTYLEYSQGRDGDLKLVQTSNRFQELSSGGVPRHDGAGANGNGGPAQSSGGEDGFTEINTHAKKQRARQRINERKASNRCDWRLYCYNGNDCKYGHTQTEEQYFKLYGPKRARKLKLCNNRECTRGSVCLFAHGEGDLFCPTCGETGSGHDMADCPERNRNGFN